MMLGALIAKGQRVADHRPWPRAIVTAEVWRDAIAGLANGALSLFGLWGDDATVHLCLLDETSAPNSLAVLSLPCPDGAFPSVGVSHPPALSR